LCYLTTLTIAKIKESWWLNKYRALMELREKNLSQWHFDRRKSHTEQPGIEVESS
jgi:hypothetical protein